MCHGRPHFGQCKLCLKQRDLQKSHLLPQAAYEVCREPGRKNPNPIAASREIVLQTSKQIAEHLLCRDCEQLFSRRGEDWVLSRMARSGNSPLFNALSAAKPYGVFQHDEKLYASVGIPEIDAAKLVYFAISVFWRSSAKRWKDLNTEVGIELGPYREPLRKWLLDEGAFPKNAALVICVPPTEQAVAAVYSPRQMKNAHFHRITFYIPGVEFTLCLGNKIPAYARERCAHASPEKFIFTSPEVLDNTKKAYAELRKRARLSKSLLDNKRVLP